MRGRRPRLPRRRLRGGSIPAGAGPTRLWRTPLRIIPEHPRGCGADRFERP
ncbi:hypothetical protein SFR_6992 (plasmid) [Streptomyces sp. FR-008]|nr:hypothetical protein SFR_6992 [Streptomyces sp. FR-008]